MFSNRSQCCGVKWGVRVLRVRSVSREEPGGAAQSASVLILHGADFGGKPRRGEVVKWVCVASSNPEHTERTAAHSAHSC